MGQRSCPTCSQAFPNLCPQIRFLPIHRHVWSLLLVYLSHALRREKEAQKVYEAAEKALGSSLDLKKILDLICYSSRDILKVKGTSLLIRQKDGPFLELAASYGLSDNYVTKGALDATRSIAEVQLSGKGFFVDEADRKKLEQIKSCVMAP